MRAKLPKGDWLWPAIWMLPKDWKYGGWPISGEIDIMESRGNVNYTDKGPKTMSSAMHWGPDPFQNQFRKTQAFHQHQNGLLSDDFHTYGLYWDDKQIYTYIDSD